MLNRLNRLSNPYLQWITFVLGLALILSMWSYAATAKPLPLSESVATLQGTTLNSEELSEKPLMLVFWASWCLPCRKEVPWINDLNQQFNQQMTVLGVSEDDEMRTAQAFIRRFQPNYPSMHDNAFALASQVQVRSLPQVLLFSKDGEVLYQQPEPPTPKLLQRLLNEAL